jgi:carbonic anhydrase
MKKLIQGVQQFRETYYAQHPELFEQLSQGQSPRVLFISCSDSRVDPALITQTDLGDIFVIRNAGNIVPPYGATNGGEGATIEYAISALNIEQVIICGHSHCGAMKGLLKLNQLQEKLPLVYDWLKHTEATRQLIKDNHADLDKDAQLEIAVAENVLTQIENLKTYPIVRSRIYQGKLHIYAWVYHIETGEVLAYNPITHEYEYPQSTLPDYHPEVGPSPGEFKRTDAPVVACDRPIFQVDDMPDAPPSQPSSDFVPAWLSPEQAARIYHG